MLKGIPSILSPELLKVLASMGHGDEIVIGDGNFPAETMGKDNVVVRADGHGACELLDAILTLFPLDTYADDNFILMNTTQGDPTPEIWEKFDCIAAKHDGNVRKKHIDRFDFYERAKKAYAVVATGETAIYACVILKKGVIK